jgi:hypothetical protein
MSRLRRNSDSSRALDKVEREPGDSPGWRGSQMTRAAICLAVA